nr:uncharacterized protein LOC122273422 [Parasteatoda tepidariorum]
MWRHVPGHSNPADLPSRGCSVQTLKESKWWEGPQWLKGSKEEWPDSAEQTDEDEVSREREKPVVVTNLHTHETTWYLKRFSKYSTIVRMVAWILRFCTNCRNPGSIRRGELSVDDINSAEQKLLKIVQKESFGDTVTKNKLKGFNTFRDADDLIRIKTKIFRREDEENFKCPIVLPSDHPLVEKLIYEKHLVSGHRGTQVVLSDLRQTFWVLRGRKTVHRILKRCIRCKRYSSKKLEAVPASLPEDRVRDALVFEVTGVGLAGPLYLKNGDKVWILLFTCAVYRAIHLELIQS